MNEDDYLIDEPEMPMPPPKVARAVKPAETPAAAAPSMPAKRKAPAKGKAAANPRDGRVTPGADGEAASFEPGKDAAPPAAFDPAEICKALDLYWENDGGDKFVLCTGKDLWSKWPVASIKLRAREEIQKRLGRMIALAPRKDSGEVISEMDKVLLHAREARCVEAVLPALAGYRAGHRTLGDGRDVVIRMSPRFYEPVQGDWEVVRRLVHDRLDLGDGDVKQAVYFHAWCKVALESLMFGEPGSFKPGHALVLAGPVGCGKSRLQVMITHLFGGRKADPTAFLMGDDSFNADMMGSEHLMMEELLTSSWSAADRVTLSESIKRMVANESKRMRMMRTDPITVDPFWRFTLSLNNDPDKMRAFPMLTPDFRDKVLMLEVAKKPMPMPTGTAAEQKAFNTAIKAALPGYVYWLLNEFVIPPALMVADGEDATRFGFASFQHPRLAEQLFDDSPAAGLLRLIDQAEFESRSGMPGLKLWDLVHPLNTSGRKARGAAWENQPGVWQGSAEMLEDMLCGHVDGWTSSVSRPASRLLGKGSLISMLQRLREDKVDRVDKGDRATARGWRISAAPVAL